MKTMKVLLGAAVLVAFLGGWGCSRESTADLAAIQGTWKGAEQGDKPDAIASLILSGRTLELRTANTNVWYQGTFTLQERANPKQMTVVITNCPFARYVGKTAFAIYRLVGNNLTIAANEPGNPKVPAGFDAPGVSQITFSRE